MPREVAGDEVVAVYTSDDLHVDAVRVPHGIVPAVAFRVSVADRVLVFESDTAILEERRIETGLNNWNFTEVTEGLLLWLQRKDYRQLRAELG